MSGGFCAICFGLSGLETRVISPIWLKIFVVSLVVAKSAIIMAMWSCNGAGKHASMSRFYAVGIQPASLTHILPPCHRPPSQAPRHCSTHPKTPCHSLSRVPSQYSSCPPPHSSHTPHYRVSIMHNCCSFRLLVCMHIGGPKCSEGCSLSVLWRSIILCHTSCFE